MSDPPTVPDSENQSGTIFSFGHSVAKKDTNFDFVVSIQSGTIGKNSSLLPA